MYLFIRLKSMVGFKSSKLINFMEKIFMKEWVKVARDAKYRSGKISTKMAVEFITKSSFVDKLLKLQGLFLK